MYRIHFLLNNISVKTIECEISGAHQTAATGNRAVEKPHEMMGQLHFRFAFEGY